jgi:V/A-type H+-transporting ATPase subunit D
MASMNVNPTRMELTRLKRELATAKRGHKLLKDKQDEMVRQFMNLIKQNRELRIKIENELTVISSTFNSARLKMSYAGLMEALMVPSQNIQVETSSRTIMNMSVPSLNVKTDDSIDITYGFAFTPCELDDSVIKLSNLVSSMVKLAEIEKSCDMLAGEIEKTRRRVNAIEYVLVPNLEDTIHFITMKLEDNERSNIIRLMKNKEIILNRQGN